MEREVSAMKQRKTSPEERREILKSFQKTMFISDSDIEEVIVYLQTVETGGSFIENDALPLLNEIVNEGRKLLNEYQEKYDSIESEISKIHFLSETEKKTRALARTLPLVRDINRQLMAKLVYIGVLPDDARKIISALYDERIEKAGSLS
ncbi:hypothetical protein COU16_01575 [Candidatus Kaiserbacteria bacterium CG10_big_fil_rev_8_21_14_0_10_47_16]|uniref:Ras-GAP domain-containing protein n=1 Tax=Candidatus Kaiserbacteria bacterium CG10_big_fil_rev_8_21_14_0_10_47_16 TaxID=1974608 RepID=A0A2H0UCY6_9BACT|nr:MAG: hypothetical protein COU16_01575 [Candidatus Kaiserbacteria bacterium CG10_big_fil_rev_8_21_14_0_10_47_16]